MLSQRARSIPISIPSLLFITTYKATNFPRNQRGETYLYPYAHDSLVHSEITNKKLATQISSRCFSSWHSVTVKMKNLNTKNYIKVENNEIP